MIETGFSKFFEKLLTVTNDNISWRGRYDSFGLSRDDHLFRLLNEFSDKNWKSGDSSVPQSHDGPNTLQLGRAIFAVHLTKAGAKEFFGV